MLGCIRRKRFLFLHFQSNVEFSEELLLSTDGYHSQQRNNTLKGDVLEARSEVMLIIHSLAICNDSATNIYTSIVTISHTINM